MLIIDGYKLHSLDVWQGNTRWDVNINVSVNVFPEEEEKARETSMKPKRMGFERKRRTRSQ